MTRQIAFLDIDGTILDHDKNIPSATKEAIEQLKQNNVYVAIATGRAPFMFEDIREELDIQSYISFNGQYVVFEGEVVYQNPITTNFISELYQKAEKAGHPMVFLNESGMRATQSGHSHIQDSLSSLKFNYPDIDARYFMNNNIHQALLFCEADDETHYLGSHDDLDFIRWHPYSMDVLPLGGSKAVGIENFIKAAGIAHEHTYAFGDGLNDIEMIQYVQTGVAMGNAHPKLKEVADVITKDVEEEGLAYGFKLAGLMS
ncbi:Cof-type HAD-IIB family hydrolase [Pontibacillus litoralis]|uniref:Phosphatase n=1 Tax=Pontibacillus litoralis JSM 072002 TaxID=1385512 RepID=A0A0A5GCF0_9BACI|nr:Cof-type HAD-IIB family hydrolase [Pontibacillus litoralis]KGX88790.1 phosphatase [Pontibacillus litoralis JSM 072002]